MTHFAIGKNIFYYQIFVKEDKHSFMYSTFIPNFIHLFFPASCLACHNVLIYGERYLCTLCLAELPHSAYHFSEAANLPNAVQKFYGKVPVWQATALFKFEKKSIVQSLLHHIKYKNQSGLCRILGSYYGKILQNNDYYNTCDLVLPVPLHKKRLDERGYNQSAFMAKGLASSLQLPCYENGLVRKLATETQTKKGRLLRWENVKSAFVVSKPSLVTGKHILLVDDVVTTGSTLTACVQALFSVGACKVSIATLAVAE